MAPSLEGCAIVIMGVSGSGKSTIGNAIAESLGCTFLEADNFHSRGNKEKMRKGIPLSDEDRMPWLESLRDATRPYLSAGKTVVLACSALLGKYREVLRQSDADYNPGNYASCRVRFVCLDAPAELLANRIAKRSEKGNHFMPVTLLKSQLDLLQLDDVGEGIFLADATLSVPLIVAYVIEHLNLLDIQS